MWWQQLVTLCNNAEERAHFASAADLDAHQRDHAPCLAPDCAFVASKALVIRHYLAAHMPPEFGGETTESYYGRPVQQPPVDARVKQHHASNYLAATLSSAPAAARQGSTRAPAKLVARPVWRCEPCDKDFLLQSQLRAHIGQHEQCSEPGCRYSASKRLVTEHRAARHGFVISYVCHACGGTDHPIYKCPMKLSRAELAARQQKQQQKQQQQWEASLSDATSASATGSGGSGGSDGDGSSRAGVGRSEALVALLGHTYRLQEAVVDGKACLVLVK
ncbi:hypothetical protein PybrP1_010148, partial [[Pythium] brassicae (nom. inval.)]